MCAHPKAPIRKSSQIHCCWSQQLLAQIACTRLYICTRAAARRASRSPPSWRMHMHTRGSPMPIPIHGPVLVGCLIKRSMKPAGALFRCWYGPQETAYQTSSVCHHDCCRVWWLRRQHSPQAAQASLTLLVVVALAAHAAALLQCGATAQASPLKVGATLLGTSLNWLIFQLAAVGLPLLLRLRHFSKCWEAPSLWPWRQVTQQKETWTVTQM